MNDCEPGPSKRSRSESYSSDEDYSERVCNNEDDFGQSDEDDDTSSDSDTLSLENHDICHIKLPQKHDISKFFPSEVKVLQKTVNQVNDLVDEKYIINDWTTKSDSMKTFEFTKKYKLLAPLSYEPYDAFRLFFDDELLDVIVEHTNANAYHVLSVQGSNKHKSINWTDLTREELLTFLGLILHTGTIRMNRLNDYWKQHWLYNFKCFSTYMSRNRFIVILQMLKFSPTESKPVDRLSKINHIVENLNEKMKRIYYPGRQLLLDESFVLWRNNMYFRQNMKKRRYKYDIKFHVLAEPEGLVLKFLLEAGAGDKSSVNKRIENIVLNMMEDKMDVGHALCMGEYYNSYELAKKLLDRQTYCTGPLRENAGRSPKELEESQLMAGENKSLFFNGVHIGKWSDHRLNIINYISTEFDDNMMQVFNNKDQLKLKPQAYLNYHHYMAGVDNQDKMLSFYSYNSKSLCWYKKLFIHILQMSVCNAFHLFSKFYPQQKINFFDFRLIVLEKLLPNIGIVDIPPTTMTIKHTLTKIENLRARMKKDKTGERIVHEIVRKECRGCRAKKKRLSSIFECKDCPGSPGYCTQCFCDAHS